MTWVLCSLPPYLFQLPLQPSELLEVSSCGRPVSRVWRALQNVVGFQPAFNCHLPDPRCAECCKINVLLASNVPSFMNPSLYVLPHAQHQLFLLPKLVAKRRWLIRSLQWGQGPESPGVLDLLLAQRVFYHTLFPRAWTFFHTFFCTTRGIAQPVSFLDLTNDKVRTWRGAGFFTF